jgi:hypothetical protein
MSNERVYEFIAEITSRRRFLGKLAATALGSVGMLIGLSTSAQAYDYACCRLCFAPGPAGCSYPQGCSWCWTCNDGLCTYQCCECHVTNSDCLGDCNNVVKSWATFLGCGHSPSPAIGMSN